MASDDSSNTTEQSETQTLEVEEQEVEEQEAEIEEDQDEAKVAKGDGTPRWLWDKRPWDAFKTFAIIFSFVLNFTLLIVMMAIGGLIIPIVNDIVEPIVGGLNDSFIDMSEATISQEITIDTTMPISFTLPLDLDTDVVLTGPVPVNVPATFVLPGGGGQINGNVNITLPAGLILPVSITAEVPVDQVIPVSMQVPVEIPLADTELGVPFRTLRGLFAPLNRLLVNLPSSNEELSDRVTNEILGKTPTPPPITPMPQ